MPGLADVTREKGWAYVGNRLRILLVTDDVQGRVLQRYVMHTCQRPGDEGRRKVGEIL